VLFRSHPCSYNLCVNLRENWIILVFLAAFLAVIAFAARAFYSIYPVLNSENLDAFIRGFGAQAVLVYAFAYLLSSPIPFLAPILAATGGLLFGPILGTLLAISIAGITSLVPFLIARHLGRAWVAAKLKGGRLDTYYQKANQGSGFAFVLLLRLVPVMPWELQNYVAGVTRVSIWTYLGATMLGSIPLSVALVILGSNAKDPTSWQFFASLALTGVILLAPILFVALRNRKVSP
jgi:uncharacterized membrane protein YdjX (TVP38/TMEM64 family)